MNINRLSLVQKLCVYSFAILLVPLLQQSALAHSFSTSFLTISAHQDSQQLNWSWRFTAHDIEALTGSSEPTAALSLLGAWLEFSEGCRAKPKAEILQGVHAGEVTYTYTGTAPCSYSPDIGYNIQHIFGPLPDHKVLRGDGQP